MVFERQESWYRENLIEALQNYKNAKVGAAGKQPSPNLVIEASKWRKIVVDILSDMKKYNYRFEDVLAELHCTESDFS